MTTLTKIRIDGVEYDIGGGSSVDLSNYVKKVQDNDDGSVQIRGGATNNSAALTLWGGNVEPDFGEGGGAWELSSKYEGNGCAYIGDASGNLTVFGNVNSKLLFRTFAYVDYSGSGTQRSANLADYALLTDIPDLSAYALKSSLGALSSKDTITHAEVSDWNTATDSFASKTYADDAADAAADAAVPFVTGTQTASTAAWTGNCPELSELRSGQSIRYWLPNAGAANDTLELTLADGTSTGAIPCYYRGSTRLGTQVAAGTPALLTYVENADAAGTTIARGWWLNAAMDTTTNYYDRLRYQVATYAKSAIAANNIIVADATGGYFQLNKGTAFSILHPILYTTGAIASGKTATTGYLAYYMSLATTQAGTWTTRRPVFIKGHLNGTTFTPASTTPLTQTVPTTEDGYQYMYIGCTYSTTHIYFEPVHPIYEYRNGAFRIALDVPDANTTEY